MPPLLMLMPLYFRLFRRLVEAADAIAAFDRLFSLIGFAITLALSPCCFAIIVW